MHSRSPVRGWIILTLLVSAAIGGHLAFLRLGRNFHEVLPGVVYRSAQPSGEEVEHYGERYGIRSILNLRGARPGHGWYDQEIASSHRSGIVQIDFAMRATEELSAARYEELVDVMRRAPKPLLIHCEAGVNRTGLASALYLAAIAARQPREAELQLSLTYGYLSVWVTDRYAMMRSFEKLMPLFKQDL